MSDHSFQFEGFTVELGKTAGLNQMLHLDWAIDIDLHFYATFQLNVGVCIWVGAVVSYRVICQMAIIRVNHCFDKVGVLFNQWPIIEMRSVVLLWGCG